MGFKKSQILSSLVRKPKRMQIPNFLSSSSLLISDTLQSPCASSSSPPSTYSSSPHLPHHLDDNFFFSSSQRPLRPLPAAVMGSKDHQQRVVLGPELNCSQ
ncbi:unnamed protein product [Lupinus luteus]|uniref:Uncharacterized protein n=1 Tax=Lupinus luteus TaxID=3873 RepID=A0AAV1W3L4_LUPLU